MSSTLCMSLLVYESAIMSAQRCSRCLLTSSAVQRQRSSVSVSASCECDVEMQLLLLFASVPFLSMCVGQSRLWPMGFARCALAGTFIGGSVCSRGRPRARPRRGGEATSPPPVLLHHHLAALCRTRTCTLSTSFRKTHLCAAFGPVLLSWLEK